MSAESLLAAPSVPAAAAAGPEAPAVDLLRTVKTVVAVSSAVKGSSEKPEFLVDGDLETAWNSQSGDLQGWVAVRIPRLANVTAIKLTAGYPKVKPKGDLFVMNHRVRRVRVLRDNELVGEYSLDPEQRGLQTLPVQVAGGDLRIEVIETLPGTKPSWRELCISELQVLGTLPTATPSAAGPAEATPAKAAGVAAAPRPVVRVGSLDAATRKGPLALADLAGPFESPEDFAKAQGGTLREPKLWGPIPAISTASGPFLAVRIVAVGERCRLGVKIFRGWFFSAELATCPAPAPPGGAAASPPPGSVMAAAAPAGSAVASPPSTGAAASVPPDGAAASPPPGSVTVAAAPSGSAAASPPSSGTAASASPAGAAGSPGGAAALVPPGGATASRLHELSRVTQLGLYPGEAGHPWVLLAELLVEDGPPYPGSFIQGTCSAELYVCGIGSSGRPSCTSSLLLGDGGDRCGKVDGESEWSFRCRAGWQPTDQLDISLDENASLGPTECEGRPRECARAEKERRRQIRAAVPEEIKALGKAKAVVFP